MNPRMPYYPNTGGMYYHHNGYGPPPNARWNEIRPENSMNHATNWDRNSKNNWKRNNRNWQQKFNHEQSLYTLPKKNFQGRFPRNNYYEANGHPQSWPQQHKAKAKPTEVKDAEQKIPGIIASKKKRKPMSKSYPSNKWDEKDAEKALQAEKDFVKNLKKQSLIIRFPDPELSKEIVQKFHPQIESVHFPQSSTPRYCFAHLDENADLQKVVSTLEKIPFGQGFLSVDIKKAKEENCEANPKDIDPYTLYVGNLPLNVTKQGVIEHFPGSTRIDIGHPQQLKNTRYAFVRFANVDDAIKVYKTTRNTEFESRSLIVRFRRKNGNVGVPGENKQANTKTKAESSKINPNPATTSNANNDLGVNQSRNDVTSSIVSQTPDLNLVKEEPPSDDETVYEMKPDLIKQEIKSEPMDSHYLSYMQNEDEVEHEEHDDYIHDPYQYMEAPEEYEDEDDYDEEEEPGSDLDLHDSFLPMDEDGDMFKEAA